MTPRTINDLKRLLRRVDCRQRVRCAVIAAEMVLDVWEEWAAGMFRASTPRHTLQAVRKWLDGTGSRDAVRTALDECRQAAKMAEKTMAISPVPRRAAQMAARSATSAAFHAISHGSAMEPATDAVLASLQVAIWLVPPSRNWRFDAQQAVDAMVAEWWSRCEAECEIAE